MIFLGLVVMSGLITGILLSYEIGYRIGRRHHARTTENGRIASGAMEGSVFAIMGLLLAFTFYGAASRFDIRRNLAVQEADAIRTAYLWVDLLAPEHQPQLRKHFRTYLESRLALYQNISSLLPAYQKLPDMEVIGDELARSNVLQSKLWLDAVTIAKIDNPAVRPLVLSSISRMFEISTAQTVALATHPPVVVFVMLALTVIVSAVLAGYNAAASAVRDWVPIITFVLMLSVAMFVILDYEYPRIGFIRIDPVDQLLEDVLEEMK